jgi:hypothetical protein
MNHSSKEPETRKQNDTQIKAALRAEPTNVNQQSTGRQQGQRARAAAVTVTRLIKQKKNTRWRRKHVQSTHCICDSEPWYVPTALHTHKQVSLHYTPNKQNGCPTAQASSLVAVKPTGSQLQSSKLAAKVSPYQWHWMLPCAFDGGLFCYEGGNRLGGGG